MPFALENELEIIRDRKINHVDASNLFDKHFERVEKVREHTGSDYKRKSSKEWENGKEKKSRAENGTVDTNLRPDISNKETQSFEDTLSLILIVGFHLAQQAPMHIILSVISSCQK